MALTSAQRSAQRSLVGLVRTGSAVAGRREGLGIRVRVGARSGRSAWTRSPLISTVWKYLTRSRRFDSKGVRYRRLGRRRICGAGRAHTNNQQV